MGLNYASAQPDSDSKIESNQAPKLDYANPYMEHASLAAFSVGSLVVGGVFYALQSSMPGPRAGFIKDDRSTLGTAVGAAGITAAVAGIAYFFYSARDVQRARSWDAHVSGGFDPGRKLNVSAALSMPIP